MVQHFCENWKEKKYDCDFAYWPTSHVKNLTKCGKNKEKTYN